MKNEKNIYHVIELRAENFKRLRAVRIKPDPEKGLIVIAGRNEQGKSSILDAFMSLFAGKRAVPKKAIRDGCDTAEVAVDIGDAIVKRSWREGGDPGGYLTVIAKDGLRYPSPQAFLDSIVGAISFDPLEFLKKSSKEQVELLLKAVGLDEKLGELDRKRKIAYDNRRDISREVGRLKGALSTISKPDKDIPDIEIDTTPIMERSRAAERRAAEFAAIDARLNILKERIVNLRQQMEKAQQELEALEAQADIPLTVEADAESIRKELEAAIATNRMIRDARTWRDQNGELLRTEANEANLTATITSIDQQKKDLLKDTKLPVENMTLSEDHIEISGIPFDQDSDSRKLKISILVAMKLNPKLRVLRIKEGSLLDVESLAYLERVAQDNDFQILLEKVDDDGKIGFVVEDGEIVNTHS